MAAAVSSGSSSPPRPGARTPRPPCSPRRRGAVGGVLAAAVRPAGQGSGGAGSGRRLRRLYWQVPKHLLLEQCKELRGTGLNVLNEAFF